MKEVGIWMGFPADKLCGFGCSEALCDVVIVVASENLTA
jgi:hypothetical protein